MSVFTGICIKQATNHTACTRIRTVKMKWFFASGSWLARSSGCCSLLLCSKHCSSVHLQTCDIDPACSATKEQTTGLNEPMRPGLDDALEYIIDDELVEVGSWTARTVDFVFAGSP